MTDLTTTDCILTVEPFVFSEPTKFVGPVLFNLRLADVRNPKRHTVKATDDGYFMHRIVWGDMSGVKVKAELRTLPPKLVKELRAIAREECELIEKVYHGSWIH